MTKWISSLVNLFLGLQMNFALLAKPFLHIHNPLSRSHIHQSESILQRIHFHRNYNTDLKDGPWSKTLWCYGKIFLTLWLKNLLIQPVSVSADLLFTNWDSRLERARVSGGGSWGTGYVPSGVWMFCFGPDLNEKGHWNESREREAEMSRWVMI